jgi:hypothetical protein
MKKYKINKIAFLLFLLITTLINSSCEKDFETTQEQNDLAINTKKGSAILSVSYTMTTFKHFDLPPYNLSEFEMSYLNPSSEKNEVSLKLFTDGTIYMEINKKHFDKEIKIPTHILPDDRPEIVKIIISGNTIKSYDTKGNLRTNEPIEIPNQIEMVNKIKELGKNYTPEEINQTIATMQGHQFINNLNEFINNAQANNVQIVEQGDNFVTLRMALSNVDANLDGDCVLLIDKAKNRLVGNRIYSADNKLLQTTYFGYNTGQVQNINAMKTISKVTLPSGFEIDEINLEKIDNFKFNLNI